MSRDKPEFLFDRPLVADLTLCASARSSAMLSPRAAFDPRGLSADLPPGILVRNEFLKERMDSFVSDLLNEGYESKVGPGPVGVCEPEVLLPSLDGWLPIFESGCSYSTTEVKLSDCFCARAAGNRDAPVVGTSEVISWRLRLQRSKASGRVSRCKQGGLVQSMQ